MLKTFSAAALIFFAVLASVTSKAQPFTAFRATPHTITAEEPTQKVRKTNGLYFQWGYNKDFFTRSNIHFRMSNGDRFTLHRAKAHDRGNYPEILGDPANLSIPQYNWRLGFYLNPSRTRALELSFDHTKYIVEKGQEVRVSGVVDGQQLDETWTLDPSTNLHFEHSDGANFLQVNYVWIKPINTSRRLKIQQVLKAGGGLTIPRTDFTWRGDQLNNKFHIAGYCAGVEGGARVYALKGLFFEGTAKTGMAHYINAFANTRTTSGNRANHMIGYVEFIATLGVEVGW